MQLATLQNSTISGGPQLAVTFSEWRWRYRCCWSIFYIAELRVPDILYICINYSQLQSYCQWCRCAFHVWGQVV